MKCRYRYDFQKENILLGSNKGTAETRKKWKTHRERCHWYVWQLRQQSRANAEDFARKRVEQRVDEIQGHYLNTAAIALSVRKSIIDLAHDGKLKIMEKARFCGAVVHEFTFCLNMWILICGWNRPETQQRSGTGEKAGSHLKTTLFYWSSTMHFKEAGSYLCYFDEWERTRCHCREENNVGRESMKSLKNSWCLSLSRLPALRWKQQESA